MNSINSIAHLSVFLNKLENNEPFAIVRAADGEYKVMVGEHLTNCDNWTFSGGSLQQDLINMKDYVGTKNFYIGIPCKDCNQTIYDYYMNCLNLRNNIDNLTYANVFCNKNWKPFISFIKNKPFYYIGPGENNTELNIVDNFLVDPYLVNKWDRVKNIFIRSIISWVEVINKESNSNNNSNNNLNNNSNNKIFLFSAGPISKVVIPILFKKYPNHTFLDVGSSIDIFTKGTSNRFYINEGDSCTNIVCDFNPNGHKFISENSNPNFINQNNRNKTNNITALLNFYRRPHTLIEQVNAVKNQTFPPSQIIIWKNTSEDNHVIPKEIQDDPSIIIIDCNKNMGVWARFSAAMMANTPYVCVFDDDTIPGRKWFENCINTMDKVNGLLGTIGLVFKKGMGYEAEYPRMGWEGMNNEIKQVDIVGHSWFFRREWLHHLWSIVPDHNLFLRCGEDIGFSWALQQIGINTYVPPHPKSDYEMFGSMPKTAWKYGTENVAIAADKSSSTNFNIALDYFVGKGFKKIRDSIPYNPYIPNEPNPNQANAIENIHNESNINEPNVPNVPNVPNIPNEPIPNEPVKDFKFWSEYDNFKYYHNDEVYHNSIIKGHSEPYTGDYDIINKYLSLFPHKNRTFIDIGAHIGTTVMPFLKLYKNCIAYEPQSENFRFLVKNIQENKMSDRTTICNIGVGNKKTNGRMIYHEGNNSGCYYFKENENNENNNEVLVNRLDDMINHNMNNIDFIKIDTEGYELNVLKGAEKTILNNKPLLQVKNNGLSERYFGISNNDIHSYLTGLGALLFDSINGNNYYYFPNDSLCIEPKRIFCFWTGNNEITPNRKESLKTIENYTLITPQNLNNYILKSNPLHEAYQYLSETHKSDYLRTYFMHFYGGGYTDIKRQTGSWLSSFDKLLENKEMYAIGYREVNEHGISIVNEAYKSHWQELIGNGCYIFRPYTDFTKKWYETMLSILDQNLDVLRNNPARHPRDCIEHFQWTSYPIRWSQILGDIFHPICYSYKDRVLQGLPLPLLYDYL